MLFVDISFHGFQSPPEMVFLMRLDGVDWTQSKFRKKPEEFIEIKIPIPHREMFIHLLMIIMEVNLNEVSAQRFNPDGKRGFAENMMVTGIETESKMV
jgi:hypothetical protein